MKRPLATNRTKKYWVIFLISLGLGLPQAGFSQPYDWEPLPWGLTLEEVNSAYAAKGKQGRIIEDKERSEIDLQYTSTKSFRISRGELVALVSSTDPLKAGSLFGYSYEGKFFGQVFLYKDHPGLFPETAIGLLKKKYPQGAISRSFGATRTLSQFEYKSDNLYVFTSERGVFFYQPLILDGVVKKSLGQISQESEKYEKKMKDLSPSTP